MEVWCLGALLLVLSFANYRFERSVLYPPFTFCFLWLFILAIYQSGLVELDPLRTETIFLLGAGAVAFTAGGACAKLIPKQLIALKLKLWSPAPEKASSSKKLLTGRSDRCNAHISGKHHTNGASRRAGAASSRMPGRRVLMPDKEMSRLFLC